MSRRRTESMSQVLPYNDAGGVHYLSRSAEERSIRRMKMDETVYRDMFAELEGYEKRGIDISLDG